jgi:hypothetical protein
MPAPTLAHLFQLEALVPAAAVQILRRRRPNVFTPGSSESLPDHMWGARFTLGDPTGREVMRSVAGQLCTDFGEYRGLLEIDVDVLRDKNEPYGGPDGVGVSRRLTMEIAEIRAMFLHHPPPFAGVLPYWQVSEIRPLPTVIEFDPSELTLCVMDGEFPAVE